MSAKDDELSLILLLVLDREFLTNIETLDKSKLET